MITAKRLIIGIVLLASLLTLGIFIYAAWQLFSSPTPKYDEATELVNTVADKLGRTAQSQISFRHRRSPLGALYSYDVIEVIFRTDKTPAQLTDDLQHLESTLNEKGVFSQNYLLGGPDIEPIESLQRSGLLLTLDNLSFQQTNILREDLPSTARWYYRSTKSPVVMEIDLMQSNARGDKWAYEGKVIDGNIVVLTFFLSYF